MKSLALALVVAACSTDTFTGPDGAPPDEGGTTSDAGGDGASACTQPGSCPAGSQCNSFDEGAGSLPPWSDLSANGGQVIFESDQRVTCPDGLAAIVPAGIANQPLPRAAIAGSATLNVPSAAAHARLELDVIFPKVLTGGATFLFMYANSDAMHGIGVLWSSGNWYVHDAVTNDDVQIEPKTDAWNHVALDIVFAQSGAGQIVFDYTDSSDTHQMAKLSKDTLAGAVPTTSAISFGAGITPFATPTAPMKMIMDDVVFSPQ